MVTRPEPVGTKHYVGFAGLKPRGDDTIELLGATVVGGDGLLSSVYATPYLREPIVGAASGTAEFKKAFPKVELLQVAGRSLTPGRKEPFYFVVVAEATKPGTFKTEGIRVTYNSGGERDSHTFPWRLTVIARG